MNHFDPDRGELKFRLTVSVVGFLLLVLGVALRGMPGEPVNAQIVAITGAFLAASAGVTLWRMRRVSDDEDPEPDAAHLR